MPDPVTGVTVGATLLSSSMQADAAESASAAQSGAAQAGIEEQRRQFDALQAILKPYVDVGLPAMARFQAYGEAGPKAFEQQQALAGVLGPERQAAAIAEIEQGAGFQARVQAGEEALLQRASATGGLRGGNIQAALAQFRPQMLGQEIERQYGRLGGFTDIGRETEANLLKIGQASAAGVGAQGIQTGTNIANLLGQQGAATARGEIAQAKAYAPLFNLPGQLFGGSRGGFQGNGRVNPISGEYMGSLEF